MQEILTISHTCPICQSNGLMVLFEHNLRIGIYQTVCENENYSHVEFNGSHYLVRKSDNIAAEKALPSVSFKSLMFN